MITNRIPMTFLRNLAPYMALLVLFGTVIVLRPLFPIDETRYATVAWEMAVRGDYILPTLNFAPYHHKPPVLFWLINVFWTLFGVHRWVALIPIFGAGAALMALTQALARRLFPNKPLVGDLMPWLILGSLPFLVFSTLLMFDVLLSAFVAAALLFIWQEGKQTPYVWRSVALGVVVGLAILTKGPVALVFIVWPIALYVFWRGEGATSVARFLASMGVALAVCLCAVAVWVVPVVLRVHDGDFAFWLLWEQTVGRIEGNFGGAHSKGVFFYLLVAPGLFVPWVFFRSFWRGARVFPIHASAERFLLCSIVPVLLTFTLFAGKQPHYILPLLPLIVIGVGAALEGGGFTLRNAKRSALLGVGIFILAHGVASVTIFPNYDLRPFAAVYTQNSQRPFAFVRNYQGELGFLARVQKPMESLELSDVPAWLAAHPQGVVFIRYKDPKDVKDLHPLFVKSYKSRTLGVFEAKE